VAGIQGCLKTSGAASHVDELRDAHTMRGPEKAGTQNMSPAKELAQHTHTGKGG
jgi:hypothetical protein